MSKRISIVIRTLNERQWVEPLLVALRAQTLRDLEIVVVDSGSTDGTREIAAQHADQVLDIQTDSFSYGYALNFGVERTKGDLVAFLSAHTMPTDEHWLANLSAPFEGHHQTSKVALAYGKQRGNHLSKLSEEMDFQRQYPERSRRQQHSDFFCNNANALIRRDLWQQQPFDESLPGLEDMAWAKHWMERGFEIAYVASAGIVHIHDESWPQVYRRFRREMTAARMSDIPVPRQHAVVLSEARALGADLWMAARRRSSTDVVQSALYRYWKTKGSLDGLRAALQPPMSDKSSGDQSDYRALEVQGKHQARIVRHRVAALKPNEVLIRVSHVGICQTDLEILGATLGYYKDGIAKWPLVPGHEYSGLVVRTGANVEGLGPGDAVVGECILSCGICAECLANRQTACKQRREVGVVNFNGACAEFLVMPARFVHRLPSGTSLLSACSVEPLAVVIKGLRRLGLSQAREAGRSSVLVIGAGPIGNLCAQVCHQFGHRVTCIDLIPERLRHLDAICESTSVSVPSNLDKFEYVIESTGSVESAKALISRTATGSSILFLGFPYGDMHWNLESLVAQDRRFVGSVGSDYDTFEAAIRTLPALDLTPFNATVLDLQDWEAAYRLHESKRHLKIKLCISPGLTTTSAGRDAFASDLANQPA